MKKIMTSLFTVLALTTLLGCSGEDVSIGQATEAKQLSVSIQSPVAGVDYPTDSPIYPSLKGKLILAIKETNRIVVDGDTQLVAPLAGIDYPTEIPTPAALIGVKILVLKNSFRLPVRIESAKAGIDFPTDGVPGLNRDFLVWDMGMNQRVRLSKIKSISPAKPGIDFPTDSPADQAQDFYIYEELNADYSLSRIVIKASR